MSLDVPPPPPSEPTPGTASGSTPPLTPIVLPAGAATRSPVLLLVVAAAAVVGLIANSTGLAGFPGNAPVEMLYAFGITVDLLAVAIVCGIGAALSRRGYPLRDSTALSIVAVCLAGIAVLGWIVFGGIGSIVGLATGSGRYMYASGGLFYAGAGWVLALVFGSHAYRRGGSARNNRLAIIALVVVGVVVLYAIVSSVLYGLGLTE